MRRNMDTWVVIRHVGGHTAIDLAGGPVPDPKHALVVRLGERGKVVHAAGTFAKVYGPTSYGAAISYMHFVEKTSSSEKLKFSAAPVLKAVVKDGAK